VPAQTKKRERERREVRDGPHLFTERIKKREALTLVALSLTGEVPAALDDQYLHAIGEDECTDITCEGRKKREVCEDGRRERTAAHG
jgi:hypothetical protein